MTIPVSRIVRNNITIGASFPAQKGFGILNCVTAELGTIGFAERIRAYGSAESVAADWPADSEVTKLANSYFGQRPKPTEFRVSVRAQNAIAAELRGGSVVEATAAAFIAIADGSFAIEIDGVDEDITGLDFTAESDLDDIAIVIEDALQDVGAGGYTLATCVHDGARFYIRSGTTGALSTIKFLTTAPTGTDISSLMQMRQGEGTKANGVVAETITAALNAIEARSQDWYGLIFTKEVRDGVVINGEDAVVSAAAWCQARVKTFFNVSNDLDVLDSVTTNDIISVINDAGYDRTLSTFSSYPTQYPGASIAGRAFTVDFSQPNSTITLKFKQGPGITAEDLSENQKAVLDSKRGNAFFKVGEDTVIYGESFMGGDFFFDEIHGTDWLKDAVEKQVYGYMLSRPTKVPYTDPGTSTLEQQTIKVLAQAVRNGLGAPGTTVDGEFLPNGYKTYTIAVADVLGAEKTSRQYNGLGYTLIGAGAIHGVQIEGIFER